MHEMHKDATAKIEYDEQVNKYQFFRQWVGAHDYLDLDEIASHPDTTCMHVDTAVGSDSTGDGTGSAPYQTPLKAWNECTATRIYVVITNNGTSSCDMSTADNPYCEGIFVAAGVTHYLSIRVLDYSPSDSNSMHIDKDGSDSTGDGTSGDPVLTIEHAATLCDGTHQNMLITDSGTYQTQGLDLSGDAKNLRAAIGCAPTVELQDYAGNTSLSSDVNHFVAKVNTSYASVLPRITQLAGGGFFVLSLCTSSGAPNSPYPDKATIETFDDSYNRLTGPTDLTINSIPPSSQIDCVELLDGNIMLVYAYYTSTNAPAGCYPYLFYKVITTTGTEVVAQTKIEEGYYYNWPILHLSACRLSDGKVFITTSCSTGSKELTWTVIDPLNGYVQSLTHQEYDLSLLVNPLHCCYHDGKVLISFGLYTPDKSGYMILQESDWSVLVGETITVTGSRAAAGIFMHGDAIMIQAGGTVKVLSLDGTIEYGTATKTIDRPLRRENGDIVWFKYLYDVDESSFVTWRPTRQLSDLGVAAIINGIRFTATHYDYISTVLSSAYDLTIKYCEFNDFTAGDYIDKTTVVSCSGALVMDHTSMVNCDIGVDAADNDVSISDCQFAYIIAGVAVTIDGAGSGIIFEHNDVFACYAGLQLDNNDGNEVVKNCKFAENDNFDIQAETEIDFSHSTYTSVLTEVDEAATALNVNPLVKNDGSLGVQYLDLTPMRRDLGDEIDSPVIGLADETSPTRDAGCWDVIAVGAVSSFTSFTFNKPNDGMSIEVVPTEIIKSQNRAGGFYSRKSALSEIVTIKFKGMLNAEKNNFLQLLDCDNSEIRFYPDSTDPNYNVYNILYDKFGVSARHYRLTRTGVMDTGIQFARAYSYGS